MTIDSDGYRMTPTGNESYYEKRAGEEEIYLEETEEELRSELIAEVLQCPIFCAVGRVSVAQLFLSSSSRRRGCGEVGSA